MNKASTVSRHADRKHIEGRVENLSNIHLTPTTAALGRRDHRLD
jgi:hypothetical protein